MSKNQHLFEDANTLVVHMRAPKQV